MILKIIIGKVKEEMIIVIRMISALLDGCGIPWHMRFWDTDADATFLSPSNIVDIENKEFILNCSVTLQEL